MSGDKDPLGITKLRVAVETDPYPASYLRANRFGFPAMAEPSKNKHGGTTSEMHLGEQ